MEAQNTLLGHEPNLRHAVEVIVAILDKFPAYRLFRIVDGLDRPVSAHDVELVLLGRWGSGFPVPTYMSVLIDCNDRPMRVAPQFPDAIGLLPLPKDCLPTVQTVAIPALR